MGAGDDSSALVLLQHWRQGRPRDCSDGGELACFCESSSSFIFAPSTSAADVRFVGCSALSAAGLVEGTRGGYRLRGESFCRGSVEEVEGSRRDQARWVWDDRNFKFFCLSLFEPLKLTPNLFPRRSLMESERLFGISRAGRRTPRLRRRASHAPTNSGSASLPTLPLLTRSLFFLLRPPTPPTPGKNSSRVRSRQNRSARSKRSAWSRTVRSTRRSPSSPSRTTCAP